MIDNSLDANATTIRIREDDGDLVISDNGDGFDDIKSAFTLGESSKDGKIGRYGVGMKDASIRYSRRTVISSRGRECSCDWEAALSGEYNPISPYNLSDGVGTDIIWEGFRELYPKTIETSGIRRTYALLLDKGVIEINGTRLTGLDFPNYTSTIDERFLYNGKSARIYGGIFKSPDSARKDWYGYNIYYRGRLIGNGQITNRGMGDICTRNFCFIIELDDSADKWSLATNKDQVSDEDGLLDFAFNLYTRDLLRKSEEEAIDIDLGNQIAAIEGVINGSAGNITRRGSAGKAGAIKSTKSGPLKRRTFSDDDEGEYTAQGGRKKSSDLKFRYTELDSDSLGQVTQMSRGLLVELNKANPFVSDHQMDTPVMAAVSIIIYSVVQRLKGADLIISDLCQDFLGLAGGYLTKTTDK